jgi:hypothetical protein
MNQPLCKSPLALETLAGYWQAELGEPEQNSVEEHLMGCGQCSAALDWIARMSVALREAVRSGNLPVVLSPGFLARLVDEGLRIRQYAPPSGGGVQCTVTQKDDLLIGRLRADLRGIQRLDAILRGGDGSLRARLEDIPFRPEASAEIIHNEPIEAAKRSGPDVLVIQLVSVEPGGDRLVGEYTFNHSPSRQ